MKAANKGAKVPKTWCKGNTGKDVMPKRGKLSGNQIAHERNKPGRKNLAVCTFLIYEPSRTY
jgi:hypothetical protein